MLKYGLVSEFSYEKGKAKVNFQADDIVSDWLPIVYNRTLGDKAFDFLSVNEQVVCLMDENSETGVILGSIYSTADTPSDKAGAKVWGREFEDGTVIKYDQSNHKLTIKVSGSGAKVEFEGDVEIDGKLKVSDDISTTSGDVKAGVITLKTHKHPGVQTGGGITGTPTP
jgi:phage baseplate assembly protein V